VSVGGPDRLLLFLDPENTGASSLTLCSTTNPSACSCSSSNEYIACFFSLCSHPQVLITSLGLCAGAVGGFEPDSRYQASTGSFSTLQLASLLDLPHAAVRVASSTVAGLLLVAACADAAGALRVDAAGASVALLDVRGGAAVRLVSVGARWGL
jgi:hypothetical protein